MYNYSKKFLHKAKLYLLILLTLVFALGAMLSVYFTWQSSGSLTFISELPEEDRVFKKFAYVAGEVNTPGVFEITDESRVLDVINLAGGFTPEADTAYIAQELNLARKLKDEEQIFIPALKPVTTTSSQPDTTAITPADDLINLNTATLADLDTLPGIGPSTAQKIIDNRPYAAVEDLSNVSGIGDSTFNSIKDLISV